MFGHLKVCQQRGAKLQGNFPGEVGCVAFHQMHSVNHGFSDEGSDIVCSAVSALTQTAALGINEVLNIQTALDITEANMYLMLPADISDQDCEKAQIILETMALGLRSIAATYGDYIKISERKV